MFYNCRLLQELPNISNWDISKVKDISSMFFSCLELANVPDKSIFNSNIKDTDYDTLCKKKNQKNDPNTNNDIQKQNTISNSTISSTMFDKENWISDIYVKQVKTSKGNELTPSLKFKKNE